MNLASPFALLFLGLVLILMGFNVLREYERAVIFRWGRLARGLVGGNGPGVVVIIPFIDKLVTRQLAHRRHGRPAAGRDHQRQRHGESQRGDLFPRGRPGTGDHPSRRLSLRHLDDVADDAAQRAWAEPVGRPVVEARTDQRRVAADHRPTDGTRGA